MQNELEKIVGEVFAKRQKEQSYVQEKVTVGWPVYGIEEIMNALDSLLSLRISQGPKVRMFEQLAAQYVGTKYAVAVNSGSSANLLALTCLLHAGDVKKGDEVILPAATFSTVASPVIQLGLVPVYVDVDPVSWNIDPEQVRMAITDRTRVIMPVHSFGNPADMNGIMKIAEEKNLIVLEDCCEAHGAAIGDKKVGSFGDLATLSFFVAHNITTGEGGMIFTNNDAYYDILTSLREFGRLPASVVKEKRFTYEDEVLKNYDARYIFTRLGYNVRMTDIEAALGIEQIKKLDSLNIQRIAIVDKYQASFEKYIQYIQLPVVHENTFHSFYGYPFLIREGAPFSRLDLVTYLEKANIETRSFFAGCLPDQPGFRDEAGRVVGDLPVSRLIRDNSVFIGCHPAISEAQIDHVIQTFDAFFQNL